MDIILFGMQGSGKGTQGKLLANTFGFTIFEMGGALRHMIASGTELGNKVKATVESGQLVSDDIIMQVVEAFLQERPKDQSILFDGIPRTMHQATELLKLLEAHGREAYGLHITLTEKEAIDRLTKRRICVNCKTVHPGFYEGDKCSECGGELVTRSDDTNLDSIQTRLDSFQKETVPVIELFKEKNHLFEVDGQQDIEVVTEQMGKKVEELLS